MKSIFLTFLVFLLSIQISNAQWVQMSNGMGNQIVNAIVYSGNNIFAGTSGSGVYLSTNNGANWTQTTLSNRPVYSLAADGNNIFAGTYGYGISLSTDNGINWVQTSLNYVDVTSIVIYGYYIIAGTYNFGIYISTNNGTTWSQSSIYNRTVYSLARNGNIIFAGCSLYGVNKSSDNGQTWLQTPLINRNVYCMSVYDNYIYAGTGGNYGIYLSTNNGTDWSQTSLNWFDVRSITASGNNVFAGIFNNGGIYGSNDNGITWTPRNEGLPITTISALCVANNYLFAGPFSNGVYRRPLGELVGFQQISYVVPKTYSLSQNYPNPFNPTTKIKFDIPAVGNGRDRSAVQIVVYDISGRLVEIIVDENLNPGTYEVTWDASKFSSGVYYFRLTSWDPSLRSGQGFSETKKMILIK